MRRWIPFTTIVMLVCPVAGAADWITLPAAPPAVEPADPTEARREAKLKEERREMSQEWQQSARSLPAPRRQAVNYFKDNNIAAYAFHFNDSWNTPLKLPEMITAQDFPNIAPPLPPRLPHGLAAPLGGAPHMDLPSPQFNHQHW